MEIPPSRINILWNAADAYNYLNWQGVMRDGEVSSAQVAEALARQAGKFFRLIGHTANSNAGVILGIVAANDDTLRLRSYTEPEFEGEYSVAPEPPVSIDTHGDLHFDVVTLS